MDAYDGVRRRVPERPDSPNTAESSGASSSIYGGIDEDEPKTPTQSIKSGHQQQKSHKARKSDRMTRLRGRREPLIDQHYRVNHDTGRRVVLPGIPRHDPDWARDLHDFFNLAVLVPVITLNVINWNWDLMWKIMWTERPVISKAWTGDFFFEFFYLTAFYFCVDLIWIIAQPRCVKSPMTIIQHHIATLFYIYLPYHIPQCRWLMGACMIVELNTWFLIARRVFNRQNFPPTVIGLHGMSIRVKVISILFYITWIGIRCILYPYLIPEVYNTWVDNTKRTGTTWNLLLWAVPLHMVFCLLNLKWSYDLLMSKIRYWRRRRQGQVVPDQPSKGL